MVILVSASSRAKEWAAAIEQKNQERQVALCYRRPLQAHQYDIIVVDESFEQAEAGAERLVASPAGIAMPVYVNLSLHGTDRVAKQVNRALQRLTTRVWRRCARRRACCATSYGQVTAILLNSELVAREGQIAASAATTMKGVHDLAEPMRARLDRHAADHFRATGHTPSKSVATAPR